MGPNQQRIRSVTTINLIPGKLKKQSIKYEKVGERVSRMKEW